MVTLRLPRVEVDVGSRSRAISYNKNFHFIIESMFIFLPWTLIENKLSDYLFIWFFYNFTQVPLKVLGMCPCMCVFPLFLKTLRLFHINVLLLVT